MEKPQENQINPESSKKPSLLTKMMMLGIGFELAYIIALPLVAFGLLGKWADKRIGTDPWFTVAGIIVAIAVTTIWMTRRVKEILNQK